MKGASKMENQIKSYLEGRGIVDMEFLEFDGEKYIFSAYLPTEEDDDEDVEATVEVNIFNQVIINGELREDIYLPFNVWSD